MGSNLEDAVKGGSHAASEVNPLKSDPELLGLLKRLDKIHKYKTFQRWKSKFLDRLETFLYEDGMKPAEATCTRFAALLQKVVKSCTKVQDFIDKGDLSSEKKSVKGALSLNEMCNSLTKLVEELGTLIPSKRQEEKLKGFTKFHLGAVLIRQGFHQYVSMKAIEDATAQIGQTLGDVADRQQHELFAFYAVHVQRFCDVMADLNLYEVMLKCVEFQEAPEEEESSDEEPVIITIKVETEDGSKVITLQLDPAEETLGSVKQTIAPSCSIAPERQVLRPKKKKNSSLDDDSKKLQELGIADGDEFVVEPYRIPITVNNAMDGSKLQLKVDPTEYLSDLKRELSKLTGLAPQNQKLCMKGGELKDDLATKIADFGIEPNSVLDLEPKSVKVNVKLPDGTTKEIDLKVSDQLDDIKSKIAGLDGSNMDPSRQLLKYDDSGKDLPSDTAVKDMGLKDGSTIRVDIFKVPVTVNLPDGRQIQVMLDPADYVSDVKRQLEPESNIPAKNQRLLMEGTGELDDNTKRAKDYGVVGGSVLDLVPKSVKVYVEMPDGKLEEIEISPSDDTGASIKRKIEAKTGMAVPRQVLKFNNKEVPDEGVTAGKAGITDGSTLQVDTFKVPITVNTYDGKELKVMVDPTDYLSDVKKQLEPESGVPAKNQKLSMNGEELADDKKKAAEYGIQEGSILDLAPKSIVVNVDMPDGNSYEVEISPSDTGSNIKKKIEAKTGMTTPRQVIKFNGKEVPDDSTATKAGIKDGSTIKVDVYRVPVTVKTYDGKWLKVMVDPSNCLLDVKKQLEPDSGVAANNQSLSMHGTVLANDKKTASDYGIKGGSVLELSPKSMKVTVEMPDGTTHDVDVSPTDTGSAMKKKIEALSGMAAPRQVLKVGGKELPNNGTVKDTGIKDGSTIKVEVFQVPVTVNTYDGKHIKVLVDPSESVSSLKKQLEKDSGIPAKNQRLSLNDQELVDNKTAADSGIKKGSVLDLEPKTITVNVEMPDGSSQQVSLAPSSTSDAIKKAIEDQTGMAAPRQVLKHNGKKIPDGKTARQLGIRDGNIIECGLFKVPVTVKTYDGKTLALDVEPTNTVDEIKKLLQKDTGVEPKKQCLKFGDDELTVGRKTAKDCGIQAGSTLTMDLQADPIIFVDIKCGTLFAVDRDDVIEKKVLTPHQNNKLDFTEAAKDSAAKDKILQAMLGSPTLGIATQVVVTGMEVEDYELEEAEKVKSMWGVNLKKREKNKKGEEFLFVDPKTGACGELSRKKYVDNKFITPVPDRKGGETLEEREEDTMVYDRYVKDIRNAFGVSSAK